MKKLFENLKPILIYWASVLILYIAYFMADFDFITKLNRNELAVVFFYISLAVLCILLGRFTDLKACKAGLIILALQLVLCPVAYVFDVCFQFAAFGNYMFSSGGAPFEALFHYNRSGMQYLPDFIFSLAYPAFMVLAGYKLKKYRIHRKDVSQP